MLSIDLKNCTGCTACANTCPKECIQMISNCDGFICPQVDKTKCINCKQCDSVCPIVNKAKTKDEETVAFAAYILNEKIRRDSSSGGLFSEIASYLLDKNGIIYGAIYDEKYYVQHIGIKTSSDLYKLRGAKYSQSNLNKSFIEIRKFLNKAHHLQTGYELTFIIIQF